MLAQVPSGEVQRVFLVVLQLIQRRLVAVLGDQVRAVLRPGVLHERDDILRQVCWS